MLCWKHLLNVYKIIQETIFDWNRFLNIYKIAEEMKIILKAFFQTFIMKCLINSTQKHLKNICWQCFENVCTENALQMFNSNWFSYPSF